MKRIEYQTFRQRVFNQLITLSVAAGFFIVGLLTYWSFTGTNALTVSNEPVPVKPKFVKSLEKVELSVDFCKHTNATGRIVRKLVSDKTELLAPVEFDPTPAGCYKDTSVKVPIPDQTPPGKYRVVYRITYETNPLHKEVVEEFSSEPFEVTP